MEYPKNILQINHPNIVAIPIQENGEKLIDIRNMGTIIYGPSPEIPNNLDYTKMRKGVYERLLNAQKLLPSGYKFCLYEAYRSLSLQAKLFNERLQKVKENHPNKTAEEQYLEAIRLVSPLKNLDGSDNVPPHSTGGAIDVYLLDEEGNAIDMGIHPKDWMQDLSGIISVTLSAEISEFARSNRAIMSDALEQVGFANYTGEYWHWSYGDKYWAYTKGQPFAIYGSV